MQQKAAKRIKAWIRLLTFVQTAFLSCEGLRVGSALQSAGEHKTARDWGCDGDDLSKEEELGTDLLRPFDGSVESGSTVSGHGGVGRGGTRAEVRGEGERRLSCLTGRSAADAVKKSEVQFLLRVFVALLCV